jgi:hypothetical protein
VVEVVGSFEDPVVVGIVSMGAAAVREIEVLEILLGAGPRGGPVLDALEGVGPQPHDAIEGAPPLGASGL